MKGGKVEGGNVVVVVLGLESWGERGAMDSRGGLGRKKKKSYWVYIEEMVGLVRRFFLGGGEGRTWVRVG